MHGRKHIFFYAKLAIETTQNWWVKKMLNGKIFSTLHFPITPVPGKNLKGQAGGPQSLEYKIFY